MVVNYFIIAQGVSDLNVDTPEAFSGVLVSDFYAAYHHYDGPKQRCWAHLLRDIHDLRALYLKDAPLARWAAAVQRLYPSTLRGNQSLLSSSGPATAR